MDAARDALSGQTALVTGASDGVGFVVARMLARSGARLILPVRNGAKGEAAAARIRAAAPGTDIILCDLDLARLESVTALAASLRARHLPIDRLVLNAGVALVGDRERHLTVDGMELHFQTNFFGHAVLVREVLPLLVQSRAQIAVQVSLAAARGRIHWNDLQREQHYGPYRAYAASKLALGLFGMELARRVPEVSVHLSHPGIVPGTAIAAPVRALVPPGVLEWAVRRLGNSTDRAAQTAFDAVMTTEESPVMFAPDGPFGMWGASVPRAPFRRIADAGAGAKVWREIDRLAG